MTPGEKVVREFEAGWRARLHATPMLKCDPDDLPGKLASLGFTVSDKTTSNGLPIYTRGDGPFFHVALTSNEARLLKAAWDYCADGCSLGEDPQRAYPDDRIDVPSEAEAVRLMNKQAQINEQNERDLAMNEEQKAKLQAMLGQTKPKAAPKAKAASKPAIEARTVTVTDSWGAQRVVGGFGDVGTSPKPVYICPEPVKHEDEWTFVDCGNGHFKPVKKGTV